MSKPPDKQTVTKEFTMAQCKSYPILPNVLSTLKETPLQPGYRYSNYQVEFKNLFLNQMNPALRKIPTQPDLQSEILLKPPNLSVSEGKLDSLILMLTSTQCHILTKREVEITSFWLSGYSIKESARIFEISQRTVEEYRSRTKEKLKVKDKKALYELASTQGTLDIYFRIAKIIKDQKT